MASNPAAVLPQPSADRFAAIFRVVSEKFEKTKK
jgi:hypothetical protein